MSDMEVEEVSFLPGDTILHKKSVYEPTRHQRCQQLICSRTWAIVILILLGMLLVIIASIAAFARPECKVCASTDHCDIKPISTVAPKPEFIATNGKEFPWKNIRLPESILPISYDIFMHPNISTSVFKGRVKIMLDIQHETDFIVFHITDLNITDYSITASGSNVIAREFMEYKKNKQFYILLERSLKTSENVQLEVKFEGQLISKLEGFYKSTYKTKDGEERHIATTHFEPTAARAAFPCFDEPQMKATFRMSIVRDKQHVALFNMPLLSSKPATDNNLVIDEFQLSKRMSTYLVAFVVSDFDHISDTTKNNVTVSVYAPKDMINQAEFALNSAVKILEYYDEFFGVPYPLPKQDLIAIPDFAAGAMENWGLITYRLTALLYDPSSSSLSSKQWVATVVAHELAHQWFGNLVTMEWWDDLWLNEGFASYVEYLGTDVVLPNFRMTDQFIVDDFLVALNLDSLSTSHPIQTEVSNPDQINEIFDKISYNKGSSILKMLREFLGEENFKKGLSSYLTTHKYGNAKTSDLWESLQGVSGSNINVKDVMDTWTLQMGYPLVTIKRSEDSVTLEQDRFLFNPNSDEKPEFISPFDYQWYIPFTYITDKNPSHIQTIWMNKTSVTIEFDKSNRWIKGNVRLNGFYRVDYGDMWHEIIKQLQDNHKTFNVVDRVGLVDDAFMLSRCNKLDARTAIEITKYMENETEYIVWSTVITGQLKFLLSQLRNQESYQYLQKYIKKLISNQIKAVGWNDEGTVLHKFLRTGILDMARQVGHKETIEKGKELFLRWKTEPDSINQNIKSVILRIGIEFGDEDDWNFVWEKSKTTLIPSEKDTLVRALVYTKDVRIINMYLNRALNDTKITDIVLREMSRNPVGQIFAWQFLQEHWQELFKRYGSGSFTMTGIVQSLITTFNTQFYHDQVKNFFDNRDMATATRAVRQSLESITSRIDWMEKNSQLIGDWLKENYS
ncbi:hypothetical protein SNE40_007092 [Patella caerulea]|uniref:Aminopeptidase n=1 Tax=Patella caerulea TaxID=87958 RepID=A0AAN8PTA0_PATCE